MAGTYVRALSYVFAVLLASTACSGDSALLHAANSQDYIPCTKLKDVLSSSVIATAISFFADHPRTNRTFDPFKVQPLTATSLFSHYYGQDASAVDFKNSIVQLVHSTVASKATTQIKDRDELRRDLYSYISADSREYARERSGDLFRAVVHDYGKGTQTWDRNLCVAVNVLDKVFGALEVEFYRIRNEVGDIRFGQFLALGVGSTLAFAIDDTGSMSGEIKAATQRAKEIVRVTRGSLDAPQDFVLVPFNDPDVGPVTVTNNAKEYHEALSKLYAHGGGDAPEMCMRGIQLAIENSRPGSIVYVITDVDAKDYKLQDTVVAQALQKSIVLTFMLTNKISRCSDVDHYKRCMGLYGHIARQTGGKVLVIGSSDIFRATDIVQSYAKQGVVLLKKITIKPDSEENTTKIIFFVDRTVQEILLDGDGGCDRVKVIAPQQQTTMKLHEQRFGTVWTSNIKLNGKGHAVPGQWTISVQVPRKTCIFKVQAKTAMGFVFNILGKDGAAEDYQPMKRYPSADEPIRIALDSYGFGQKESARDAITDLKFVDEYGSLIKQQTVEEGDSTSVIFDVEEGVGKYKSFFVLAEGKDYFGNKFQRMHSALVSASHIRIECDASNVILRAGIVSRLNVTVHNFGPEDDFIVTTADNYDASAFHDGFAKHRKFKLISGQSVTKVLRVLVDEKTKEGTAVKITITAKGNEPGSFQYASCTPVVGRKLKPRIDSFSIVGTINARLAETVVTSDVTNNADVGREAEFDMLLPQDAFITSITIKLPNETIHGVIQEKKKAKRVYDKAKASGKLAGHVAAREKSTRAYRTSMFVEARQHVQFILTYQQLLRRVRGRYEYAVVINPDQPIRHLSVNVHISEEGRLSFVRVPPMKTTLTNLIDHDTPPGSTITYSHHNTAAHVHYEPTIEQQTTWSPHGLSGSFLVEYDVMRPELFGQVSIDNGYFAHFFAPMNLPTTPKIVIFVIDTSGSMYGNKMKQMKDALSSVLDSLNKEDRFNLVLFGDTAQSWIKDFMPKAVEQSIKDAKKYIRVSPPKGGTNVEAALTMAHSLLVPYLPSNTESSGDSPEATTEALQAVKPVEDEPEFSVVKPVVNTVMERITKQASELDSDMEDYAKMIVLLTDGRPSIGITDTKIITEKFKEINQDRYQLHTLAFGSLADSGFLMRLAAENDGTFRQVFEEIDADLQIQNFFDEISNPLLKDVSITYSQDQVKDLTPNTFSVYMGGSELIVAGQVIVPEKKEDDDLDLLGEGEDLMDTPSRTSRSIIRAQVRGRSFKNDINIDFDIDTTKESKIKESQHKIENFTERLWAFLQVKDLLRQATLEDDKDAKAVINEKALNMSLKYEFVTPLTSLVVLREKDRLIIEKQLKKEEADRKAKEEAERKAREEAERRAEEEAERARTMTITTTTPTPYASSTFLEYEEDGFAYDRIHSSMSMRKYESPRGLGSSGGGGGGGFSGDPHFMIPVKPDLNICFNWDGQENEIYNFFHDPVRNITVNGMLVNSPAPLDSKRIKRTYVSTIAILVSKTATTIVITPWNVTIVQKGAMNLTLPMTSDLGISSGVDIQNTVLSKASSSLMIWCGDVTFSMILHRGRRSIHQRDHLDFFLNGTLSDVSELSEGVFGQFARWSSDIDNDSKVQLAVDQDEEYGKAKLFMRGKVIPVVSRTQPGSKDENEICWYVGKNGAEIMMKPHEEFIVSSLFQTPVVIK